MNSRNLKFSLLGVFIGVFLLGGFTYYISQQPISYVQDTTNRSLPNLGGPFTLVDQFGKTRNDREFRGKYMLLYFGYSFCPDVCPLGLQNITAALDLLGRDIDQIVPMFITIDPERDTVESLQLYAQNWHTSLLMMTGSQAQLQQVQKAYKVYAVKAKPDGTMADYLMDHSALVYLVNREGTFIDFFPHTTDPQKMAEIIRRQLINENR